ncbi:hypothetical protein GGQ68_003881 [Sagittula marina]|uniref:Uncharacterized protein n=1 Tax=Sagittula marina TaxID=943940 RepID=A0A7W6DRM2_9RHOB|nr:hypothetical protein [Sagittula marina]
MIALAVSGSGNADGVDGAERVEAIDKGDADVDFCALAIGVPSRDALAEGLEAAHLRLYAAAGVVSLPPLPECPIIVARGAQGFVVGPGGWAVLFLESAILANWDDSLSAACDDGTVAAVG